MEKVSEAQREYRGGDCGVKYLFRGPRTDWGVILLKPGQTLGGHYHHEVEETFFFLEGTAKMIIDGVEHRAAAGDAFRLVAPEKHDISNDSDSDVKMVFIKCPYLPKDKVSL
jgi:quercetin dioxygenase-like cupin family protein